ncbi:MAG TPA: hypothetical protein VFW73_04945 [Lacipirellulaceae bacterium]|nr:hypothetical protein [Lacipirellulaceae bacterium]
MKRILASIMVLSVLSIGFVGCNTEKKADNNKKAAPTAPATPEKK